MTTTEIKRLRSRLGLTQDEMAAAMHVAPATVKSWESGRRKPSGPAEFVLQSLRPRQVIEYVNPWSGQPGSRDVTDISDEELAAYAQLIPPKLLAELHAELAPCSNGEFLKTWSERVGPEETGRVILGS